MQKERSMPINLSHIEIDDFYPHFSFDLVMNGEEDEPEDQQGSPHVVSYAHPPSRQ